MQNLAMAIIFILMAAACAYLVSKTKVTGQYRPLEVMTPNEVEFFGRLTSALPGRFVFPQVAMSALIKPALPASDKRFRAAFARISQKRVDYAICDANLGLICVVELDDRTHNAGKDAVRDAMFASAGIRTIRWHSKKKPTVAEIALAILPPPAAPKPALAVSSAS